MFGNPPQNSNGLFGKTGTNPNMMNPNVSNFNSGGVGGTSFGFGAMGQSKPGIPIGGSTNSTGLFSGQNNTT